MARMFDGEQKMSDWPDDVKKYLLENPNSKILAGQSVRSQHILQADRLIGKRVFIGYNKRIKCFTAWNVEANMGDAHRNDDICLKFSTRGQRVFKDNPVFTAFYERGSGTGTPAVYQKICVFPENDFAEFYKNYEHYMKPNRDDCRFQTPVADFH